jgi:hypothetical protein
VAPNSTLPVPRIGSLALGTVKTGATPQIGHPNAWVRKTTRFPLVFSVPGLLGNSTSMSDMR